MLDENKVYLSKHRIEVAKERLNSAKFLIEVGDYKAAANRSYYAAFSAMRAVLALDGLDFKRHLGVIAEFRKSYIKNGVFDAELSHIIDSLKDARQSRESNAMGTENGQYPQSGSGVCKQRVDIYIEPLRQILINWICRSFLF